MSDEGPKNSEPTLTRQQEDALSVSNAGVALAAGAGCGKTSVLTERFLRFLDGPERLPLRSVVALTFTDKAARELRERVREACRKKRKAGEDRPYWRGVLRGLEAAPIGTFHAFCGNLLRRFPVEAGVEPGFRVLEESVAPSLLDHSLSASLRSWLAEKDADFQTLAVEYGLSSVRGALYDLVRGHQGRDYAGWADKSEDAILQIWWSFWDSEGRPCALKKVVEAGGPFLQLADRHRCAHPVMNQRTAFLREFLPQLPEARDPEALLAGVLENARVQGGCKKDDWPSDEVFEEVKKALTKLRDQIKAYREKYEFQDDISRLCAGHGRMFARLAAEAVRRFTRTKREQGYLDFEDLLLRTRDLLARPGSSVLETLRREISVLLVDEFQDTDPVQAEILDLLRGSGRLFLVGDTKQSIYRFRGAEPKLFQEYRKELDRKNLTENFRSAPEVIGFVNALFRDTPGFDGEEHTLEPRSTGYVPTDGPAVEFLWAFDESQANARGQMPAGAARRLEGTWIARRIRELTDDPKMKVWDRKARAEREIHEGDVAILLRSLNDVAAYETALAEAGLDYYIVGGSAFFTQQEVQDLTNLLSVVEDPLDEVSLAGVLRSPFFGLSDEGLYWLSREGDLATGLEHFGRNHDLSEWDRKGAERAKMLLDRWRGLKDRVPVAVLIDRALSESGYEAAILAEHLGGRKRANVRKLVRQARKFDDAGLALSDFVARLRADLRKPPREEQASTTDEEGQAVRIMSVHQAKGLEFPVVVVPDLDRKTPPTRDKVVFHDALGMVVKPASDHEDDEDDSESSSSSAPSLGWSAYRTTEQDQEREEALRVLYVAATRARERLILSAGVAADSKPVSPALRLIGTRFDRRTGECVADSPEGPPLPLVRIIAEAPPGSSSKRKSRRRPRLLAVAREIERAKPVEAGSPARERRGPLWADLDPCSGLAPSRAQILKLISMALSEPDVFGAARPREVVDRASRRLVPMPSEKTRALAGRALEDILKGQFGQGLRASVECLRNVTWGLSVPGPEHGPSVLSGRIELACRDASGDWRLVAVADASAPVERERLRLALSARALGKEPVVRLWLLRVHPHGSVTRHAEEMLDDEVLTGAVEGLL